MWFPGVVQRWLCNRGDFTAGFSVPNSESTTSYSDTEVGGGYGYMWWITGDQVLENLDEDSYFASGYRGHYIFIIPEMDLVIVHRVNTDTDDNVTSLEFFYLLGLIIDAKNN